MPWRVRRLPRRLPSAAPWRICGGGAASSTCAPWSVRPARRSSRCIATWPTAPRRRLYTCFVACILPGRPSLCGKPRGRRRIARFARELSAGGGPALDVGAAVLFDPRIAHRGGPARRTTALRRRRSPISGLGPGDRAGARRRTRVGGGISAGGGRVDVAGSKKRRLTVWSTFPASPRAPARGAAGCALPKTRQRPRPPATARFFSFSPSSTSSGSSRSLRRHLVSATPKAARSARSVRARTPHLHHRRSQEPPRRRASWPPGPGPRRAAPPRSSPGLCPPSPLKARRRQ